MTASPVAAAWRTHDAALAELRVTQIRPAQRLAVAERESDRL